MQVCLKLRVKTWITNYIQINWKALLFALFVLLCYSVDGIYILFNQYLLFRVQEKDTVNNSPVIKTMIILLEGSVPSTLHIPLDLWDFYCKFIAILQIWCMDTIDNSGNWLKRSIGHTQVSKTVYWRTYFALLFSFTVSGLLHFASEHLSILSSSHPDSREKSVIWAFSFAWQVYS